MTALNYTLSDDIHSTTQGQDRVAIAIWLLSVAGLVWLMVMVGGATRLTESGLSMVDWRPVTGIVPPLTEADWQQEFAKYQTSPEYKLRNKGMPLQAFKRIFYWEWGHRVLGRVIGLAFALPLIIFLLRRQIPRGYTPRLVGLLLLGGTQGLLGWYMVQSGLVDEPRVSHYRLTAHLSLALGIFAALLWTAMTLFRFAGATEGDRRKLGLWPTLLVCAVALQMVLGGLVAGLKAGHVLPDWPFMGGVLVPDGLLAMQPLWSNFVDNAITVQFDHRLLAYCIAAISGMLFIKTRGCEHLAIRMAGRAILALVLLQIAVGVITLYQGVPVFWGTLHQGMGVGVLAGSLVILHITRRASAGAGSRTPAE